MAGAAARRYARAIFELAREEGQFEEWARRIASVREVLSVPEVQAVLMNPTISVQERQAAVTAFLEGPAGPEGVNLGKLLVGARRVDEIAAIEEEYGRLMDEAAGRVRATATTAVELSSSDQDGLARNLSQRLGREVRLTAAVDPSIIGGLVLRFGDHVIDASLATRLQQLRRKLAGV
ncbi:MAG: F0F1 ATP synthase subunit delta [Candidatus Nephthysia bennettiae]|uniref:ATP synthase subunit delta n=1 Tax=Candidatus Nephthysia bennettiae TaxID=3127016 RepID=A0A934K701_9BACT|nr:F0F1 ATP synthase subunit delta [Candidatus Dormibacteraeota bacterium]MBJ7614988.1 F0F1 ATP synthase subunit delta [Candidatus Dormibacteraeota bacterium]PZR88295.1 MAG: F0F1 ATP synthase subunit delta [Candidatus Dormibacteraeota bacterium]